MKEQSSFVQEQAASVSSLCAGSLDDLIPEDVIIEMMPINKKPLCWSTFYNYVHRMLIIEGRARGICTLQPVMTLPA